MRQNIRPVTTQLHHLWNKWSNSLSFANPNFHVCRTVMSLGSSCFLGLWESQRHLDDRPLLKFGSSKMENDMDRLCSPEKNADSRRGHTDAWLYHMYSVSVLPYITPRLMRCSVTKIWSGRTIWVQRQVKIQPGDQWNPPQVPTGALFPETQSHTTPTPGNRGGPVDFCTASVVRKPSNSLLCVPIALSSVYLSLPSSIRTFSCCLSA